MYIHNYTCIAPQQTNETPVFSTLTSSKEGRLTAIEPTLEGVPAGMLRRMSKAVRMGIGTGLPLLKKQPVQGIIIGTANGGMEDCIKFLNQIIDYEEGMLTPGNFVQSTPNAIAGQLSLITKNHQYNATHVHLGVAFENALTDALMLLQANEKDSYLVGAVDEISTYNYTIDLRAGWYSKSIANQDLYKALLPATIAGEGAAMFIVNNNSNNAIAKIEKLSTLHHTDIGTVKNQLMAFVKDLSIDASGTLFITGENGDTRHTPFYTACEEVMKNIPVVRFKHLTGEYPTASSFALWLACQAIQQAALPNHLYKNTTRCSCIKRVIIYNHYHGKQHSFIAVSGCGL